MTMKRPRLSSLLRNQKIGLSSWPISRATFCLSLKLKTQLWIIQAADMQCVEIGGPSAIGHKARFWLMRWMPLAQSAHNSRGQ
jgi:hypothetical protein